MRSIGAAKAKSVVKLNPHFSHSMWPAPVQEADRAGAARRAMWDIGPVPRTRSSLTHAARPIANFGFKRGAGIIELPVSLGFRSSHDSVPQMSANFGIGTLARRRTLSASSTGPSGCLSAGIFGVGRLSRMARYAFAARRRICRAERATQATWSVSNAG
jgi:hypothetical protein